MSDQLETYIEPDLEARIVAMVLGEASAFEIEELERIIGARPELKLFRARMDAIHGILRETGKGELESSKDWKLPEKKRDALLEVLSGESPGEGCTVVAKARPARKRVRPIFLVAAVATVAVLLTGTLFTGAGARMGARSSSIDLAKTSPESPAETSEKAESRGPGEGPDELASFYAFNGLGGGREDSVGDNFTRNYLGGASNLRGFDYREVDGKTTFDHSYEDRDSLFFRRGADEESAARNDGRTHHGKYNGRADEKNGDVVDWGFDRFETSESDPRDPGFPMGESITRYDRSWRDRQENNRQLANDEKLGKDPITTDAETISRESWKDVGARLGEKIKELEKLEDSRRDLDWRGPGRDREYGSRAGVAMDPKPSEVKKFKASAPPGLPSPASPSVDIPVRGRVSGDDRGGFFKSDIEGKREKTGEIESPDFTKIPYSSTQSVPKTPGLRSGTLAIDPTSIDDMISEAVADEEPDNSPSIFGIAGVFTDPQLGDVQQSLGDKSLDGEERRVDYLGSENSSPAEEEVIQEQGEVLHKLLDDVEITGSIEKEGTVEMKAGLGEIGALHRGEPATESLRTVMDQLKDTLDWYAVSPEFEKGGEFAAEEDSDQSGKTAASVASSQPAVSSAAFSNFAMPDMPEPPADLSIVVMSDSDAGFGMSMKGFSETASAKPDSRLLAMEKEASKEPFSTFSLHVSDVSFKLAHAALARGAWPDPARIRIEEFVNAFDYEDPLPSREERVSCTIEQAIHPTMQQRNLLRIAMRTAESGRSSSTPLNLTFLVDSSGSMGRFDRQETLRRAFSLLAEQLQDSDRVTLVSFARQPRLIAEGVNGKQAGQLAEEVSHLPGEGGTNLEAALSLALEKGAQNRMENSQNRIILLTDGAANLGDADPGRLARIVEKMREAGIAFDAAGIGTEGLNDEILEALTRKGDGRYYLLDRPGDADSNFARQIAGALRPAAMNVKVQVEFNPLRVGRYQLHGFEKHILNKEDFRNDQVDAAEMSAAEAGVALYHFEPLPEGSGDVGSVSVRFRDMANGRMVEKRWPIPYQASMPGLEDAGEAIRIAAAAALTASKLKGEPLGSRSEWEDIAKLAGSLSPKTQKRERVRQLSEMIAKARSIK